MDNNINKNATNKNDRPDQHQKGTLIVVNSLVIKREIR